VSLSRFPTDLITRFNIPLHKKAKELGVRRVLRKPRESKSPVSSLIIDDANS
jgi:hypothetical protein